MPNPHTFTGDPYIGKVKDITVKAKVDDADMEQAINNRNFLITDFIMNLYGPIVKSIV